MNQNSKPTAFVSYSKSNSLSHLLRNLVVRELEKLGFEVNTYANEDRSLQWHNYDANAVEASLQAAGFADLNICLVVRNFCGWIPDFANVDVELKSICRLEYEAGRKAGRHVIGAIVSEQFSQIVDPKDDAVYTTDQVKIAVLESNNLWLNSKCSDPLRHQIEEQTLVEFIQELKDLQRGRNNFEFASIATFKTQLVSNVEAWMKSREVLRRFPNAEKYLASRSTLLNQVAERLLLPGCIAITGPWGCGASTLAVQAARMAADRRLPNRMLHVNCHGKSATEVRNRLAGDASFDFSKLGVRRDLIVFDNPSFEIIDCLPPGPLATTVIVTSNLKLIRHLSIKRDNQYKVQPMTDEECRGLLVDELSGLDLNHSQDFDGLVQKLRGWPMAIRPVVKVLKDDPTNTPVENLLNSFEASDYSTILKALLERMPESDLHCLARIASLSRPEFSEALAAECLGVTNPRSVLSQLESTSWIEFVGDGRWMIDEPIQDCLRIDSSMDGIRRDSQARTAKYLIDRLSKSDAQAAIVQELLPDSHIVFDHLMPRIEDVDIGYAVHEGLIDLAKRVKDWSTLLDVCVAKDNSIRTSTPKHRWQFRFWEAGKAARKLGNLNRATILLRKALELTNPKDLKRRPMYVASLASVLDQQHRYSESKELLIESLKDEKFRRYINEHCLAKTLWNLGERAEAEELLNRSISEAAKVDDKIHLSQALLTRASYQAQRQEFEKAAISCDEALDANGASNSAQKGLILERKGSFLVQARKYKEAAGVLRAAMNAIPERDHELRLKGLCNLMVAYQQLGCDEKNMEEIVHYIRNERDMQRQLRILLPLFKLTRQSGSKRVVDIVLTSLSSVNLCEQSPYMASVILNHLGEAYRLDGQTQKSIESLRRAVQLSKDCNNERGVTISTINLAKSLRQAGRFQEGIDLLTARYADPKCDLIGNARVTSLLGELYIKQKDYDLAEKFLGQSLQFETDLGGKISRSRAYPLHSLAQVCMRRGRHQKAVELLEEALSLEKRFDNKKGQMVVLHSLARAELGCRRIHNALTRIDESLTLEKLRPNPYHRCQLLGTQARIHREEGHLDLSIAKAKESLACADRNSMMFQLIPHRIILRCNIAMQMFSKQEEKQSQALLREAQTLAREQRIRDGDNTFLHLELLATELLARQLEYSAASESLSIVVKLAIESIDQLSQGRELYRAVQRLILTLRQLGDEIAFDQLLTRILTAVKQIPGETKKKFSRLRRLAVNEKARQLLRTDRQGVESTANSFYENECDAALYEKDYKAMQGIALAWGSSLAIRGELEHAVDKVLTYAKKLADVSEPKDIAQQRLVHTMYYRVAEWLVARVRHRNSTVDSPVFHHAIRACWAAERQGRVSRPAISSHRIRLLRASLYLQVGRIINAKKVLHRWLSQIQAISGKDILSGDDQFDVHFYGNHELDAIELWSKIDFDGALHLLKKLEERQLSLNSSFDSVDIACVKARLFGTKHPYSAEKTLKDAYDSAGDLQNADAQSRIAIALGRLYQRLEMHGLARKEFERAVELRQELGDPIMIFDSLRILSLHLRHSMDQKEDALERANQALQYIGDAYGLRQATARNSVVKLLREVGNLSEAEVEGKRAVVEAEQWGDARLEGSAHLTYAAVLNEQDNVKGAIEGFTKVLEKLEHDPACTAFRFALKSRGQLLYQMRMIPEAANDFLRFIELSESQPFPEEEIVDAQLRLVKTLRLLGMSKRAIEILNATIQRTRASIGSTRLETKTAEKIPHLYDSLRVEKGLVLISQNQLHLATNELENIVQEKCQTQNAGSKYGLAGIAIYGPLARAHSGMGNVREAIRLLQMLEDSEDNTSEGSSTDVIENRVIKELDQSFVYQHIGQLDVAQKHIDNSLALCAEMSDGMRRKTFEANLEDRRSALMMAQSLDVANLQAALTASERAMALSRELNSSYLKMKASTQLASVQLAMGKPREALLAIQEAEELERRCHRAVEPQANHKTKSQAKWLAMTRDAKRALGEASVADQLEKRLADLTRDLTDDGIIILPSDLGNENGISSKIVVAEGNQTSDITQLENERLDGVITYVRETGSPRGLEVKLSNGMAGFCSIRDAFGGIEGNLRKRFAKGAVREFRVLGEKMYDSVANGKLDLALWNPLSLALHRLIGKTIPGRLLDESKDPHRDYVLVEIETGERFPIKFPQEVGWPSRLTGTIESAKILAGIWNECSQVFITIESDNQLPPRLSGSMLAAYLTAIQALRKNATPIKGTVVEISEIFLAVRLAPGVVARCMREDAALNPQGFQHVKVGDQIAVIVEDIIENDIESVVIVNRDRALRKLLSQEGQHLLKCSVQSVKGNWMTLRFGPGVVGGGRTPSKLFEMGKEVDVLVDGMPTRDGFISWRTIKKPTVNSSRLLEDVPDLLTFVGNFAREASTIEPQFPGGADTDVLSEIPLVYREKTLEQFQREAMYAISNGDNIIVRAPTGSGKTLIADWAIERVLNQRRRAIFASPVKALSNQKFRDFVKLQQFPGQVGLVTGDVKFNSAASVLVVTTETFRNWVVERPESLEYFDLAIFDEVHYLDDKSRGTAWEESIILAPANMQLIALSASVPNATQISEWMRKARGRDVTVIPNTDIPRPVPLIHHFCGVSDGFRVFGRGEQIPDAYLNNNSSAGARPFMFENEIEESRKIIEHLHRSDQLPAIFFCSQRTVSIESARKSMESAVLYDADREPVRVKAFDELARKYGVARSQETTDLRAIVSHGIGFHHSGMLAATKMVIEELFEKGYIILLFATDTFAVGVNMPARSVVLDSLWRGRDSRAAKLTGRQYTQMSGRAGRLSPGNRDKEGNVFSIVARRQLSLVDIKRYEAGTMESIESRLDLSYRSILALFSLNDDNPARVPWTIDSFWQRTLACAENAGCDDKRLSNMHARWKLLEEIGYLNGQRITSKGKLCLTISNQELTITEAWENQWLSRLTPVEIAAVFGCLNCDRKDTVNNQVERTIKKEWWSQLAKRVKELRSLERDFGIPEADQITEPNESSEPLFIAWAQGKGLSSVRSLLRDENRIGDFVNWTRMAIQGLTGLIASSQLQSENSVVSRLIEARSLLQRDEVLWEKLQ